MYSGACAPGDAAENTTAHPGGRSRSLHPNPPHTGTPVGPKSQTIRVRQVRLLPLRQPFFTTRHISSSAATVLRKRYLKILIHKPLLIATVTIHPADTPALSQEPQSFPSKQYAAPPIFQQQTSDKHHDHTKPYIKIFQCAGSGNQPSFTK